MRTVSRGFKPGGSNLSQTPALVPVVFQPEHVTAYEVGSKNRFADDRVQLNLATYYYQYENLQLQLDDPVPFQGGVGNVDKCQDVRGSRRKGRSSCPPISEWMAPLGLERGKILSDQLLLDGYRGNLGAACTPRRRGIRPLLAADDRRACGGWQEAPMATRCPSCPRSPAI